MNLQLDQFGNPQPSAVSRHQQQAVLEVAGNLEQPADFVAPERLGQFPGALARHPQSKILAMEDVPVEKADPRQLDIAGTKGELSLGNQVMETVANLFNRYEIGRSLVMPGQLAHGVHIPRDRRARDMRCSSSSRIIFWRRGLIVGLLSKGGEQTVLLVSLMKLPSRPLRTKKPGYPKPGHHLASYSAAQRLSSTSALPFYP